MCKAIQDWLSEERAEGRAEGRADGYEDGTRTIIVNMYRDGCSIDQIARVSEKSMKEVRDILDKQKVI